jgi:L-ascorbate metabolism protein UlaG (beta-lactamase superfamily)
MIDNVMHDEQAPYRPAVQEFFQYRIENAIEEIKTLKVEKGAVIWKMYNHTWIVKTPSVTIGFDIQRGISSIPGFILDKEKMKELINAVDILFISHFHSDHTDSWVTESFIEQNKPVVSTPGIFENLPVYNKILHPERKENKVQEINIPAKGIKLKTVVYPGHQGENILNNVYLVTTPEGITVSQTGDQSYAPDYEWIDKIGDNFKVDVVMTNSWSFQPGQRVTKGFRPKLIIPGHENELGHTIDHREPYWLNHNRMGDKETFPWLQMVWGEKYHYFQ